VAKELEQHGLSVHYVVINDVIVEPDCDFHRRRMEMQRPYIDMLNEEYSDSTTLVELPLLPHEVKGIERLMEVESFLFAEEGG
jgi:anion-transporting  ArsA/GET3 family ATPase